MEGVAECMKFDHAVESTSELDWPTESVRRLMRIEDWADGSFKVYAKTRRACCVLFVSALFRTEVGGRPQERVGYLAATVHRWPLPLIPGPSRPPRRIKLRRRLDYGGGHGGPCGVATHRARSCSSVEPQRCGDLLPEARPGASSRAECPRILVQCGDDHD